MSRNLKVVAVVFMFVLLLTSSCLITNGKVEENQEVHDESNGNEGKGRRFPDEQIPHRECIRQDYKCWKQGLN